MCRKLKSVSISNFQSYTILKFGSLKLNTKFKNLGALNTIYRVIKFDNDFNSEVFNLRYLNLRKYKMEKDVPEIRFGSY